MPMESRDPVLMIVRVLANVIDAGDTYARGRSLRVARYSIRLAQHLGAPDADLPAIELGALLHDLGRNAILNDVLLKARPLDATERALIQTHPTIGWELLREIPGLEAAAEIVYAHHERPDGRGYPRNLTADHIPLGARLVMVCAAYDAMIEDRPYRRGLAPRAACGELERNAGSQFFPEVVAAFLELHENGRLWEGFSREEYDLWVRPGQSAAA
jgi:putative nucleotidyltransferase with HDIG domain